MKYRPGIGSTDRARAFRREPTPAERAMWRVLCAGFPDARFRRQVPLRSYFADFASHRFRLVIEVDGGQHVGGVDDARDAAIKAQGYHILRFWNDDVLTNPEGVWNTIKAALDDRHPHPDPPPSRGRESLA